MSLLNGLKSLVEDNVDYGVFVVGGAAFYTIYKSNENIGYLLGVEFSWGNLLTKVMGCISVNYNGIYDGTVRASVQIANEVLNTLELWCIWGSNMDRDTVDRVHEIRVGVLNNMENFSNMCTEFS